MGKQSNGFEKKIWFLTAVLFFNLILISTNVILTNKKTLLENIIGVIISPFQIGFQKSVDFISSGLNNYVFLKNSQKKYVNARKEIQRLKLENYFLRKKMWGLELKKKIKFKQGAYIDADVISVDRNFPFAGVLIDRGSKDGIKQNMTVLNTDGDLVGKTVEPIGIFTAKVRLITSSIGGVGAYIKSNLMEGFLSGNNTGVCIFKYIIENKTVQAGDVIISSGTDKIFHPYIHIGKVVKVEKDYLEQKVFVKPFFIGKPIKKLIVLKYEK